MLKWLIEETCISTVLDRFALRFSCSFTLWLAKAHLRKRKTVSARTSREMLLNRAVL